MNKKIFDSFRNRCGQINSIKIKRKGKFASVQCNVNFKTKTDEIWNKGQLWIELEKGLPIRWYDSNTTLDTIVNGKRGLMR